MGTTVYKQRRIVIFNIVQLIKVRCPGGVGVGVAPQPPVVYGPEILKKGFQTKQAPPNLYYHQSIIMDGSQAILKL